MQASFWQFLLQNWQLSAPLLLVFLILLLLELKSRHHNLVALDVPGAVKWMNQKKCLVVDIRPPQAYEQGHIARASQMSIQELQGDAPLMKKQQKHPILIICDNGSRSLSLAARLVKQGFEARALKGGMRQWLKDNMPIK